MKKLFVSFLSCFLIVLYFIPFTAYADSDLTAEFFSYDHHAAVYNVINKPYYLQLQAIWRTSNTSIDYYYYTYGFYLDNIDNVTLDVTDGVYTITLPNSMRFDSCYHVYRIQNGAVTSHNESSCYAGSTSNPTQNYIQILVIDTVNNTLKAYHNKNSLYATYVFYDLNTNFDNLLSFGSDLQVSIYPHIDYNFDYTVDFDGDNIPINLIQVDITNHSDKPYEYAILIQPEGSFLEYEEHSNSRNLGVFWGDSPVTYALFKDEWFYAPVNFSQGYELINAPCPWHFISATQFKREQIYFDQMKLKAGQNYTFKVLAYDLSNSTYNDHACATAAASIKTVFSKNFSVKSDTVFNPDSDANGAYSFDNEKTLDDQFDVLKAIYNKDTGEVNAISNGTFSNVYKKTTSNGSSYSSGSTSSFNDLLIYSSSYLVLCRRVLYYFPNWVTALLLAALSGLVLIFILKCFKG